MAKATDLDLYGILGVEHTATEKELLKAYRKQALKCHPDKNPDNPKASELFQELTKALEVLTDAAARAAYDKSLKAKKAAELRHKELDSKRKKFKEDLEARERSAQDNKAQQAQLERNLKDEIERLRKEGSRLVDEAKESLEAELKRERESRREEQNIEDKDDPSCSPARLKIRWKAKKGDAQNGGYNHDVLQSTFAGYGEIGALLVSQKKNGSAILEFTSNNPAILAVQDEIGLPSNPLTIEWLSGKPESKDKFDNSGRGSGEPAGQSKFDDGASQSPGQPSGAHDFESLVLHRMRQAEERKRLIEQMTAEEDNL